jgi:protein TonB
LWAAVHARLRAAARRCYPPAARRFRLRGSAQVRLCAGPGGQVAQVDVVRSSGHRLLDVAARSCVVPAARPMPVEQGCYPLEVRFDEVG